MLVAMELPTAIRHVMNTKRISQVQLCLRCGIHRSYLYKILNGQHNPSILLLEKIAQGLEMPASQLVAIAERYDAQASLRNDCRDAYSKSSSVANAIFVTEHSDVLG